MKERDIPGASLGGRDPGQLKVPELKRWLLCRGASTKGKKADLAGRLVTVGFNMPRDDAWHSCNRLCVYLIPVQSSRLYKKWLGK